MPPTRGHTPPRQCPVGEGLGLRQCQRTVRPGQLMCRSHWGLIPGDLQRLVYSTWRAFNSTGDDDDWERYSEARAAALALVAPAPDPPAASGPGDTRPW